MRNYSKQGKSMNLCSAIIRNGRRHISRSAVSVFFCLSVSGPSHPFIPQTNDISMQSLFIL
ncbi:hypothetical protein OIU79_009502 [Salix purpurea]|uniref:Uncharacterized protein n=1 Tax=Salix purpurea TaxID=77065 RepID=A0A9Q0TKZ4_SALPP|nr:hypothetical protein OIU79_009502 [Salix purpurea]